MHKASSRKLRARLALGNESTRGVLLQRGHQSVIASMATFLFQHSVNTNPLWSVGLVPTSRI